VDAITLRNVTKNYRIKVGRARVREMVPPPLDEVPKRLFPRWWMQDTFNALEDVSISIPAGSSVGIVGHNGAGKTTLLKVTSGVTAATKGTLEVVGRIAALIDLLVGFNPDLTGRENAYFLASVHGVGRRSIHDRIEQILDFAEIKSDLADTPVKRYSAGMIARLGFAVVTCLDADILLVDEVLAVGDSSFQQKCVRWLDDYRSRNGTLVFVSHNLGLIRNMTEQAVWLDHGKLVHQGPTSELLTKYARAMEHREDGSPTYLRSSAGKMLRARGLDRWGAGGVRVQSVHFSEPDEVNSHLDVTISYANVALERAIFCVSFVDEAGRQVAATASQVLALSEEGASVRCGIDMGRFRPGLYFPVVTILSDIGVVRDHWQLERPVVVDGHRESAIASLAPVTVDGSWSVVDALENAADTPVGNGFGERIDDAP
jgi:homopolymeric O-antigen transport system ATP-binding protein